LRIGRVRGYGGEISLTAEDIVRHCRQHLAGFKIPRAVVFGELPKTSTGKIQKFELRQRAGSAEAIDV
jgi:fatty-acyl-CoA synthase